MSEYIVDVSMKIRKKKLYERIWEWYVLLDFILLFFSFFLKWKKVLFSSVEIRCGIYFCSRKLRDFSRYIDYLAYWTPVASPPTTSWSDCFSMYRLCASFFLHCKIFFILLKKYKKNSPLFVWRWKKKIKCNEYEKKKNEYIYLEFIMKIEWLVLHIPWQVNTLNMK